jgi:Ca2+/Na+ antiporter
LLTAGFLLVDVQISPVFFLGLLAALLLVSGPRTPREWFWIVIAVTALAAWFRMPTSLADHTVRAAAAFFIGTFVVLTLMGVRSLFTRASVAVLVGAIAMIGWYVAFHLRFIDLQNEIITRTWDEWRLIWTDLPAAVPSGDAVTEGGVADLARQRAAVLIDLAYLFPALLALAALASARLTWSWYHRIARAPLLAPAGRLGDFRFNDHLVWLLVALIALLVVPVPAAATLIAANALVVVGCIYALRGGAVAQTRLAGVSPWFVGLLMLIMLPFFYIIPLGLALLGIADTWLDFRRRAAPASGVTS